MIPQHPGRAGAIERPPAADVPPAGDLPPGSPRLRRRAFLAAAAPVAALAAMPRALAAAPAAVDLAAFAAANGLDLGRNGPIVGNGAAEALARLYNIRTRAAGGDERFVLYDARDTVHWLLIQTALKSVGGGTNAEVLIPPGRYRIARHIALPNGVGLRGTGAGPGDVFIENSSVPPGLLAGGATCSPTLQLGYENYYRGLLFAAGNVHPAMMPGSLYGPGSRGAPLASAPIDAAPQGQAFVRVTGSATRPAAGEMVAVYEDGGAELPRGKTFYERARLQITRVTRVEGAVLRLADPLYVAFAREPRVALFGTGFDPLYAKPWRVARDVRVENLSGTGTGLIGRSGVYNGTFERVRFSGLNGFAANALVNCLLRDCRLEARRKGIEIKGYSLSTRAERCEVAYVGDGGVYDCTPGGDAQGYLLDLGQSSARITFVDCDFTDNPAYPFPALAEIAGYDTRVQGCVFSGRAGKGGLVKIMPEMDPNAVTIEASAARRSSIVAAQLSVRHHLVSNYGTPGTSRGQQVTVRQLDCAGATDPAQRYAVVLKGAAGTVSDLRFGEAGGWAVRRSRVQLGPAFAWV